MRLYLAVTRLHPEVLDLLYVSACALCERLSDVDVPCRKRLLTSITSDDVLVVGDRRLVRLLHMWLHRFFSKLQHSTRSIECRRFPRPVDVSLQMDVAGLLAYFHRTVHVLDLAILVSVFRELADFGELCGSGCLYGEHICRCPGSRLVRRVLSLLFELSVFIYAQRSISMASRVARGHT